MFIFISGVRHHSNFQLRIDDRGEKPSSSVQFENENDVTPSVINMNRSDFPIF